VHYSGNEAVPAGQLPYVGMKACQSSTYGSISYATRALTNSVNNRWSGTCTHTSTGSDTAWWVELAEASIVDSVQITNRADCCGTRLHNVDIYVGGQKCANTGSIGQGATVKFNCATPLAGNEVMLRSNSGTYLTVCGFQVYGSAWHPTPAPVAPLATPAPTPPSSCIGYSGNEAVPAGQIPYVGMTACQSSTYGSISYATRALTNSVNNRWSGTCTHTSTGSDTAWWVQLAETSIIDSVQITNRADCCGTRLHNVDIYVGGQKCANTGSIGQGATVKYNCPGPLTGNEIMLRSNSGTYLTICGFQAFGRAA